MSDEKITSNTDPPSSEEEAQKYAPPMPDPNDPVVPNVAPSVEKINPPEMLKRVPRWVIHRNKVPHVLNVKSRHPVLRRVDVTKEGVKLLEFDQAVKGCLQTNADGIGFALDKSAVRAVCIDLDGNANPFINKIVPEVIDSYIERSPSGNGYHVWFLDNDTDGISGRRVKGLEIYTSKRFLTFTGNHVMTAGNVLATHNGLTRKFLLQFFSNDQADVPIEDMIAATDFDAPPAIPDPVLIGIIKNSNDEEAKSLLFKGYGGNYKSHSEADWHLVLKLCFWTAGNAGQIERLVYNSPLADRLKWKEREDYRRRTIVRALAAWDGSCFQGAKKNADAQHITIKQNGNVLFADQNDRPIQFRIPSGFNIVEGKGIFIKSEDDQSEKCICNDIILPLKFFENVDSQAVSVELWFKKDKVWRHATFPNEIIATSKDIIELASLGLDVTSANSKAMIAFFRAFKAANSRVIPTVQAYSQTGWRDDNHFIYPVDNNEYVIETDGNVNLTKMYEPHGDRDNWLETYWNFRQFKCCRLAVAAALAAPLLKILRLRNMTLEFWSQSGDGKTAILKFADSVYKNPLPLVKFRSTGNFVEIRCTDCSDLPFCIDDLRSAGNDKRAQNFLDSFAHLIESGSSKGRATKNIGQRAIKHFRTIAIITGENPLTAFNSDMGVKRRVLEIHSPNIFPKGGNHAESLHRFSEENFALVGPDWIELLKDEGTQRSIVERFEGYRRALLKSRSEAFPDHCNLLAACATADFFFNQFIVGDENETNSEVLFEIDQDSFETQEEQKDYVRAFDFLRDWIERNTTSFIDTDNPDHLRSFETFGWIVNSGKDEEFIAVIPAVIKDALSDAGFNPKKILVELADANLIESGVYSNTGKQSYTVLQRIKQFGVKRVVKIRRDSLSS